MTKRLIQRGLLLIGLLMTCSLTVAASPEEGIEQLEQLIQQQGEATGQQAALKELYQKTLNALKSRQQYQEKADELQRQLEQQPEELRQQQIQNQADLPEQDTRYQQMSRSDLEQAIILKRASVLQLEQQQEEKSQQVELNKQKQLSLREQLAELKQTPPKLPPLPAEQSGRELNDARLQLQNALQEQRSSHIRALELELLALPGQTELANLLLEQLQRQLEQTSLTLKRMLDRHKDLLREELENTLSSLDVPEEAALKHPTLSALLQQNRQLSEQLRQLIERTGDTQQTRADLEQKLDLLTRDYKIIKQQLELQSYSASYELRRFTLELSRPVDIAATRQALNDLRLNSLELNRLGQSMITPPPVPDTPLTEIQRDYQEQLLQNQQTLRTQLQDNRQQLVSELSQLLAVKEQLNERLQQARSLIEQQLLWLPVSPPISWQWPGEMATGLKLLQQRWPELVNTPLLAKEPHLHSILGFTALLLILALSVHRYQKRHRQRWQMQIGNVVHDRFSRTLRLLLAGFLAALPLPILLVLLRSYSLNTAHPSYLLFSQLLLFWALTLQSYLMALAWLRIPNGLMCGHFALPHTLARVLRRQFHLLFWVTLPLLSLLLFTDSFNALELQSGLGRLLFLLLVSSLILFWLGFRHVRHTFEQLTQQRHWWSTANLWIGLMVTYNLVMFGLGLWGYTLTALFFMLILLVLVLQAAGTFILYKLGLRWLLIEERKLAFSRARSRRAEMIAARENKDDTPPLKEDYLDLQAISDQSRVLLKTSVVVLLGTSLWLTLGDFLPTLQVLESVQLWSSLEMSGDQEILTHITLRDLVIGGLLIWVSLLAAKNLPGLLELLALRHLELSPGSSYAITTLLKYSLILIGVMIAIGQIGVQWSKLQWLVAALGVGLGFGLQEIVANFVSGLIILFEKPVRIGDTVTLGNVTGTVSRIQIRATTITDWDRKEVIIPNKTFITEQLINWSLSDATTRVVLTIGVAYGSDVELAEQLLVQAARDNPRVLDDPEPDAYFRQFADSTLNIDLRVYVSSMADRVPVTDELNRAINKIFSEHDIEIAFPQLDVHLHRAK